MKADFIPEPELEFAHDGHHLDIRFGIMAHGPLDRQERTAPKRIQLGIIGTGQSVDGLLQWCERCRSEIAAKEGKYPNLFPRFPGISSESAFHTEVCCDVRMQRRLPRRDFETLRDESNYNAMLIKAADLFVAEAKYLAQETDVEVVACAVPQELVKLIDRENETAIIDDSVPGESGRWQFHDILKARGLAVGRPLQMIRPSTYGGGKPKKSKHGKQSSRIQDEATRAWNIFTALYYKAKGVPWRLERLQTDWATCHVGISFYRTLDRESVNTSVAQVFNQRGQGVIVRGGPAHISKDDRTPHLSGDDARGLLVQAINTYRREHSNYPARVVIHKSSTFDEAERRGFQEALSSLHIDLVDMMTVRESFTRLFRQDYYPPLRGTLLSLDDRTHVLYSKGGVEFFGTYPGLYIPLPLEIICDQTEQSPKMLASELLSLTKMNWNNTQFDGKWPITLLAARKVGSILRHLGPDDHYEPYYGFYM
jgi:hypothetical protein